MAAVEDGATTEDVASGSISGHSSDQMSSVSGESYVGSGAKDSHHGYTFQFHLLMLYATRALNLGPKDFRIATEMAHAGKFDDVVFCYPKEGTRGGRYFQFVQAKHTLNQSTKVIRPSQLFDRSGGPFSLTKYFDSFRNMKWDPELMSCHDEVKSLVICSNMGFKFGDTVGHFVFEEAILRSSGRDEILGNELLKFKDDFEGRREVILFLKNSIISLPRVFASAVMRDQKLNLKTQRGLEQNSCLYKSYIKTLTTEVLRPGFKSFHAEFIKGSGLSSAGTHFRDELWFRYLNLQGENPDETAFCDYLSSKTIDVYVDGDDEPEERPVTSKMLAKSLVDLLEINKESTNIKVNEMDASLRKNIETLLDLVFTRRGRWLFFDQGFLRGHWVPEKFSNFRESLRSRMKNISMDFSALEGYSIEMDNADDPSTRYCGERLELDVRQFLEKLSFALNQPGITEMESQIKIEVAKFLNVSDASNSYSRFFKMMYSWAESKDARYLTEDNIKRFFFERKREMTGGIRFNLRHPIFDFVGRDRQLEQIQEVLEGRSETSRSCIPRAVVVSGLGGIGKSELAREYAKRHHPSQFDNVIWIDSETRERLESSFKMLAFGRLGILKEDRNGEVKDVEVIVQETYDFFRGKKTLFVFDNVVLSEHLSKFFPRFFLGDDGVYVLMTARTRDWKGFHIIDLDNFTPEEAFEFVHLSLNKCSNWDDAGARSLANKMSNFPLALKQACSYIEEMVRVSSAEIFQISDYINLFHKSSEKLLKCPFKKELLNSYSETTYATMMVALDLIKRSRNRNTAIPLLNVITFLSPDSIEVDILRKAYPRFTTKEVDASLGLLQKLSILRVDESRAIIHRLVQSVNKISLRNSGKEEEIIYEAMRLAEIMDVEHQMAVWESVTRHKWLVKAFCRIPTKIAERLSKSLLSSVALEFMQGAIEVLSKHLGPEDYETLCSRRNLGRILYFDGKFEEAAKVQKLIVDDQIRVLGKDDPDTLETMYHYGVSVQMIRRYEDSLEVFRKIVERGTAVFGERHSTVLAAKNKITQLLHVLGQQDGEEIEEYSQDLVAWAQSILNQSKVYCENAAGQVNTGDARRDKVKEYCRLRSKKSGNVGLVYIDDIIRASMILGEKCEREGDYEQAYKHHKSSLDLLKGEYAYAHPKVLLCQRKMISVMISMGKHEEALNLLKKAEEIENNSWDCTMQHSFLTSRALWEKGDCEGSFKYLAKSLTHGKDQPDTPGLVEFCMVIMKKMAEAKRIKDLTSLLQHLYEVLKVDVSLAPTIENVFEMASGYSVLFQGIGDKKEALVLLKCVYEYHKLIYGEDDTRTLQIKKLFAQYCCEYGTAARKRMGIKYLLEVHAAVLGRISEDDTRAVTVIQDLIPVLKVHAACDVFSKVLIETKNQVFKTLRKDNPLYLRMERMSL